jgi:hypothetical protein
MTSILADHQYTLEDFGHISGISTYELDQISINMINRLATLVGAPSYQRTPIFKNKGHHGKRDSRPRRHAERKVTTEDWEEMRNFKATKLENNKEGIDKEIDSLRMLLNKITSSNYKEIHGKIIILLKKILDDEPEESELIKVGESIFNIGSSNKFWSKLYAQLYKDLLTSFPVMKPICNKNFISFLSLFENIRYVSAEEDYDEFCAVNKENSKRRSISSFFVQLMKNNIIDPPKILNVINVLKNKFMEYILLDDKKNEVDEIGENLVIMISEGDETFSSNADVSDEYETIKEFVSDVASMKSKNYKSLTSKTVFKFMDLDDE